jgi:hypothetical protein
MIFDVGGGCCGGWLWLFFDGIGDGFDLALISASLLG